jgi:hypothetical protein
MAGNKYQYHSAGLDPLKDSFSDPLAEHHFLAVTPNIQIRVSQVLDNLVDQIRVLSAITNKNIVRIRSFIFMHSSFLSAADGNVSPTRAPQYVV